MDQQAEKSKRQDSKSNWTMQKNKRVDSKVESNDSPDIPDRGETTPRPPFGGDRLEDNLNLPSKLVNTTTKIITDPLLGSCH